MSSLLLRQRLILLAVCITAITMPFNFTAPAVALPAIGQSFGGSPMELSWVTNAFMLTFGSFLMLAGTLADSYGRKKIFIGGVSAFAILAAILPFAPNLMLFDVLRGAQGVAAALAFSGGMSALAQVFDGAGRIRAFSFVGTSFGIGLAIGPVVAGAIIETFNWQLMFLLITVLAVISLALAGRYMPESRNPEAAGIDWPGALTFTWALGIFTFAILEVPESSWTHPLVLGLFGVALLSFVAFVVIEKRVAQPMLDLSLFRFPRFVGVQLLAAAPAYSFVVLLILLPIRFVGIEGMSAISAGWLLIALSAPLLVLPIVAGYLTRWLSPSPAGVCGRAVLAQSCAGGQQCRRTGLAHAGDRCRHQPALGADGWHGGECGTQGARRHGHWHIQYHPSGRRRRGDCRGHRIAVGIYRQQPGRTGRWQPDPGGRRGATPGDRQPDGCRATAAGCRACDIGRGLQRGVQSPVVGADRDHGTDGRSGVPVPRPWPDRSRQHPRNSSGPGDLSEQANGAEQRQTAGPLASGPCC